MSKETIEDWGFVKTDCPITPYEKDLSAKSADLEGDERIRWVIDMERGGTICLRTGFGDSVEFGGIQTKEDLLKVEEFITGSFPNW